MLSQQASSEYEFFWFVVILNVASFMLIVIILSLSYSRRTEGKGTSEAYPPLIRVVPHWAEISVGFILAFMVASLVNLFASLPTVILSFVITWAVSSYLVYRYPELHV